MLWTTPESVQERLPRVHHARNLVLTADARIDNRDDLIDVLGLDDRRPAEIGDGELILAAYEKWGERCPEHLLGDFSFALWDAGRKELFCARDPMGVKSLYYLRSSRLFVFASEIKGLFCLPEVPRRLNETRVADHLTGIFEDKAITFYQDIARLPPAHSMTVDAERTRLRPYWTLDHVHEVRLGSDEAYSEAFRDIFVEAVRCRLRSISPVGSALSGGLDSSSIVCAARKVFAADGQRRLHTFSAIFPTVAPVDARIDERPYIEAVLEAGGLEPHTIRADLLNPLVDYDKILWHADEVVPAPNLYLDWEIMGVARQHEIRVLLSGFDGDSAVSHGYEALSEFIRQGRWGALMAESRSLLGRNKSPMSPWKFIWAYGLRPLAPEPLVESWRLLRKRPRVPLPIDTLIDPDFARRIGLAERAQALRKNGHGLIPSAKEMHWAALTSGLLSYALELLDKVAAARSLEVRFPFFDRRLLEFCVALPPAQKLRQGWTRAILRNAMAGILPQKVQWRVGKSNLGANFKLKLLEHERETLEAAVLDKSRTLAGYVDIPALHAMYRRYEAQPVQQERDALALYFAVTLAMWLRTSGLGSPVGAGTSS
jgi:asparagine synthase (glutamine-hydrolysing)